MPISRIGTDGIEAGAVAISDLSATGTPSSTTFLRGDNTWADSGAVGVGQTWQNVIGSRSSGVTYTNSTGRPIIVNIVITPSSSGLAYAYVYLNGTEIGYFGQGSGASANTLYASFCTVVVPNGVTYRATITGNASFGFWWELR